MMTPEQNATLAQAVYNLIPVETPTPKLLPPPSVLYASNAPTVAHTIPFDNPIIIGGFCVIVILIIIIGCCCVHLWDTRKKKE